ncbi:UDP-N-acetylmuramoyl-L-alanine--D-glutamate ligase [Synechococcus sp. WH 8016]|uniref:UDP-N-acetylmuramoyl-L-alanine--D-glutamate ligase n=1 Tax=Synechococcus sp. WH 8016 TaxID=166318 RepID=UPI00022D8C4C|nr:UDP-N-acetylmuramoyl-L-alanine--D-glutamate ligase [Synechococcus sp. WH 8016]EHA60362.1 UDP-N-acetylmuramoylalanine--D-glutamate ligase [Synechococcus sp. WH 8016]
MACSLIVGLGRSGVGAARLLHAQGHQVVVLERDNGPEQQSKAQQLKDQGIQTELGCHLEFSSFQPWLDQVEQVVISPGIPWDHPTLMQLRDHGVTVRGEMAVAWQALRHCPWIGVTGTNGKTTVTHLLHHVLNQAGLHAPMAGNVGHSAAELGLQCMDPSQTKPDWIVMEMSSYQIESANEVRPTIGIWTTLTPDHLERHGSMDAYRDIKQGLLQRSKHAVLNADDTDLKSRQAHWPDAQWVSSAQTNHEPFNLELWVNPEGFVCNKKGALFPANALAMPGEHNRQNMLLVTAAALQAGLEPQAIERGLRSFPGVPHRLENLGSLHGMNVFNDSKATNYDAAAVALQAVPGPIILLAGGLSKQGDASGWLQLLQDKVCSIALFGSDRDVLSGLIRDFGYTGNVTSHSTMTDAVTAAVENGKNGNAASLLLSPACASFDQYKDFEARGNHFREMIEQYSLSPSTRAN